MSLQAVMAFSVTQAEDLSEIGLHDHQVLCLRDAERHNSLQRHAPVKQIGLLAIVLVHLNNRLLLCTVQQLLHLLTLPCMSNQMTRGVCF